MYTDVIFFYFMAQVFKIRQNSELPTLRMSLIDDGKFGYIKTNTYNNAIQNADITFSMKDKRGVMKISKSKANVVLQDGCDCEQNYIIEYKWSKRDTRNKGIFIGWFEITFGDDIYQSDIVFPTGTLIMPIQEELQIHIL